MSNNETTEDVFQIAAKAHKLLQEILSANKSINNDQKHNAIVKQEPTVRVTNPQTTPPMLQSQFIQPNQYFTQPNHYTEQQQFQQPSQYYQQQQSVMNSYSPTNLPQPTQYIFPPAGTSPSQQNLIISPTFYMQHPPPIISNPASLPNGATIVQQPYYYQPPPQASPIRSNYYHAYNSYHHNQLASPHTPVVQMQQQHHHHYYQQNSPFNASSSNAAQLAASSTNPYYRKRKFCEINNFDNNNNINNSRFKPATNNSHISYQSKAISYYTNSNYSPSSTVNTNTSGDLMSPNKSDSTDQSNSHGIGNVLNEEEDLNIMRERELKELKCKSVVEKMSVFLKYYQQFKEAYINRVQSVECSDSLKIQFHSLIKYLSEYENLLAELNMMITEHERDHCKNNHRKTKKFFNKTKAFIRYECNKRLQSNIFEYRRLINSQDRYAGMYDLLDMNSYLISLLPDIGVSIRRYINRCEKAREQEQFEEEEDYQQTWYSEENSTDSLTANEEANNKNKLSFSDANDLTIPTFKEFVAGNHDEDYIDDEDEEEDVDDDEYDEEEEENNDDASKENKKKKKKIILSSFNTISVPTTGNVYHEKSSSSHRNYESFSKGIDSLNRYLLKRVEEEETLDELVKERIIKWINKRQAKYIMIFSEVDKLLNQHKSGECYSKFHSYLLFNLGKLVTVCDSYHQKLKELLYSTTIRRKKKRKKVKLLPEAMADVFDEIIDLKRALEHAKFNIKRCNANSTKEIIKQF